MMTAFDRMEARFEAAVTAVAATYPTMAAQKDALQQLNRAYEAASRVVHDLVIADCIDRFPPFSVERSDHLARWDMPFDLHQVRDQHVVIAEYWNLRAAQIIRALRDLRGDVKAAPVVKVEKADRAMTEKVEQVQRDIRDEMQRLGRMYDSALNIARLFNGLPVTASVHMVTNQFGTTFIRAFYYLAGERMPLSLIIAAAETAALEKGAA